MMTKKVFTGGLAVVLTLCLSVLSMAGTEMPPFSLKNVQSGKITDSSEFKDKAVFLAFFATWCPPCRQEAPALVRLQKEYADQGFSVVAISMDQGKIKEVEKFIEEFSVNYPILMGDYDVIQAYGGIYTIPTSFLVDKEGNVVKMYQGAASYAELVKDVSSVL